MIDLKNIISHYPQETAERMIRNLLEQGARYTDPLLDQVIKYFGNKVDRYIALNDFNQQIQESGNKYILVTGSKELRRRYTEAHDMKASDFTTIICGILGILTGEPLQLNTDDPHKFVVILPTIRYVVYDKTKMMYRDEDDMMPYSGNIILSSERLFNFGMYFLRAIPKLDSEIASSETEIFLGNALELQEQFNTTETLGARRFRLALPEMLQAINRATAEEQIRGDSI